MTEYQLAAMSRVGEHGEPIFRAPSVGCSGETVAQFDAAVAAELPRVSHLEYDSHEICKHFAENVRSRLVATGETS